MEDHPQREHLGRRNGIDVYRGQTTYMIETELTEYPIYTNALALRQLADIIELDQRKRIIEQNQDR